MKKHDSQHDPDQDEAVKNSAAPDTDAVPPEDDCAALRRQADEYKEKYVRLCAEFDNVRKRYERDRVEFVRYANEGLLTDLLGIVDDLDRSVAVAQARHQDYTAFLKGIEMVMARIRELLSRNQVQPIEAVGRPFDPHCHEILMQEESPGHADGEVLEEFQRGYRFGDRVIRTAKVKVAVHKKPDGETPEADGTPAPEQLDRPEDVLEEDIS